MPTELPDDIGNLIRNIANEYGATTGRPRRCGWFDAVVGRFSVMINGFTGIALTRMDVLDSLPVIQICTGYKLNDKLIDYYPSDLSILEKCQPIYEELPGWQTSTNNARDVKQLPAPAKRYISRIEELLSCPIDIVSVGAKREETIVIKQLI
jgi:adenylosuccinate synthase